MSEFEIATLASQEATRAYQQAALEISRAGITAIYVQAGVAAAGVLIHGILIAWGLRLMRRATDARSAEAQQHHAEAQQHHAESMAALRAMIQGLEAASHNLEAVSRNLEAATHSLETVSRGIETMIERTAPPKS